MTAIDRGVARVQRTFCVIALAVLSSGGALAQAPANAQEAAANGVVSGRVVDAQTGAGLQKVLVQVEDGGPSTVTDEGGSFRLAGVRPGVRRLYVSVVGYSLVRREVTVAADAAVDVAIPLSEGTGTYTETVNVAADRFRPS